MVPAHNVTISTHGAMTLRHLTQIYTMTEYDSRCKTLNFGTIRRVCELQLNR